MIPKKSEETIVYYACPKPDCLMKEPSSAVAFRPDDLNNMLKCRQCHKATFARNWECGCCIPWFTCGTHQTFHCCNKVMKQKSQNEPKATNLFLHSNIRKRKRTQEHAELVADESKRAKLMRSKGCRKTEVLLHDMPHPKIPRLLGPILHQRFPKASRSSACASSSL